MKIPRLTRFYYEGEDGYTHSWPAFEDIDTSAAYAKEKELERKKIHYTKVDLYHNNVVLENVLQESSTIPGSQEGNFWSDF
jgi:hypothetical protein